MFKSVFSRVLLFCAVFVLLGFVALLATRFSMFERGVAELRRQGQPVEFADLRLDDDSQTDARVFLVQTDGARDAMLAALESSEADSIAGPVTESGLAEFARLTKEHPQVFTLLRNAAAAPIYKADFGINPNTGNVNAMSPTEMVRFREAAKLLAWKSRVHIARAQYDEAISTGIEMLRISNHAQQVPGILGALNSMVVQEIALTSIHETLATIPPSSDGDVLQETRQRLEKVLKYQQTMPGYRQALTSERVVGISMIGQAGLVTGATYGLDYLDFMSQQIEDATLTQTPRKPVPYPGSSPLVAPMIPVLDNLRLQNQTACCRMRALMILNRIQSQTKGSEINLQSLGLPGEFLLDPFFGKPLVARELENGWLIYSPGPNGIDDGGSIEDQRDIGIGPLSRQSLQRQ